MAHYVKYIVIFLPETLTMEANMSRNSTYLKQNYYKQIIGTIM
jgi:hypothetical protein